jgi:hypothetical protein
MLSVTQSTVVFGTQFTLNIDVSVDEETPSTTIPVVSKSYTDPGVTVSKTVGRVIISGSYNKIIPVIWHYIDLTGQQQTTDSTPTPGTFRAIFKVESPSSLTANCIYTIDGETFTHTVSMPNYDQIAINLKSLLATVS